MTGPISVAATMTARRKSRRNKPPQRNQAENGARDRALGDFLSGLFSD